MTSNTIERVVYFFRVLIDSGFGRITQLMNKRWEGVGCWEILPPLYWASYRPSVTSRVFIHVQYRFYILYFFYRKYISNCASFICVFDLIEKKQQKGVVYQGKNTKHTILVNTIYFLMSKERSYIQWKKCTTWSSHWLSNFSLLFTDSWCISLRINSLPFIFH